jgi:hypothetical protein
MPYKEGRIKGFREHSEKVETQRQPFASRQATLQTCENRCLSTRIHGNGHDAGEAMSRLITSTLTLHILDFTLSPASQLHSLVPVSSQELNNCAHGTTSE